MRKIGLLQNILRKFMCQELTGLSENFFQEKTIFDSEKK